MPIIRLTNPKKAPVVIFDNVGSEALEKMVLGGIDHAILHSRYEVLYISFPILFGVLKNIKYIGRMRQGKKVGLGCLYRIYLLACLQYMKPKVVITFIDNSYSFQVISRIYKDAQFIAIQNGMRIRDCLKDSRPPSPELGSVISMPVLICFGQHDVDMFRSFHHRIDVYYPSGSLRARYYRAFLSTARPKAEFDLCVISTWDEDIIAGRYMPQLGKGIVMLDNFVARYLNERDISCCVALRTNDKKEEDYYLNMYGKRVFLIKFDNELMSSYDAIDRSGVAVSAPSTLLQEAFGWGAKVLSCNFSGDDQFDFPSPGPWSMRVQDYDLFKRNLDLMMAMDHEGYLRQTKEAAAYIMNNDSKPPYESARELILKGLKDHG